MPTNQKPQESTVVVKKALKENKIFFYGFPILVMVVSFLALFLMILPTVRYYFSSRSKHKSLDENNVIANQSISNLRKALNETNEIVGYDQSLSTYLPAKPKVGELIDLIEKTANDFNLQNKGGSSTSASQTSLGRLSNDNKSLLESLDSGEIKFKPKSANQDIEAVLISLEFNLKGDKEKFFQFLGDLKKIKPLVNVVYVDYSEVSNSSLTNQTTEVNAIVKFESYALDLNTNNVDVKPLVQYKNDDERLLNLFVVETFNWDKEKIGEIVNKLGQ